MKYQVSFRQKQPVCCPPKHYWIVRSETVEAPDAEDARQQILHQWRYNHPIEIKSVKEIKDDQKKGQ